MPRFALLDHDHPERHWDLLLEHGPSCRTWRLSAPPEFEAMIQAVGLPDHRLMYLDYEGPVSGNRGTVSRWDAGQFVWITATAAHVAVRLVGERWAGRLDLVLRGENWDVRLTP